MGRPVHKRLILPGEAASGLTIHLPRDEEPVAVCRVPVGGGEVCGKPFFPGEERAFQKHVGECAREHADEIRAESPRQKMPVFDEETWDPEVAAHMREVGRRMLREGRLETKPNERAGFS